MIRRPAAVFIFFLVWLASPGRAQESPAPRFGSLSGYRTISGSVVLQGSAIGVIRITVVSDSRTFQKTVFADGSGAFGLSGVPPGHYTFEIEAEGYRTHREGVDVLPGSGTFMVQFTMRPTLIVGPPTSKQHSVSVLSLRVPEAARREYAAGQDDVAKKRWKEAREHFERALEKAAEKQVEFPQALHALGVLDIAQGQTERAIERLRRVVEQDDSYGEAYLSLSHALNQLGRSEEALEKARKAIELRPDLWQGQYEFGVAALAVGEDALALEASQRIERAGGPNVPEIRLLRAGVWLKRGLYNEARQELVAFLQLAPNHALASLAKTTLEQIEKRLPAQVPK